MQSFKHSPHPPYELRRGSAVISIGGDGSVTLERIGALNVGGVPGAAGQVLTSNGPGAAPTWQNAAAGGVTGSGSAGTLAKWTGATALGDSLVSESGTVLTIGGDLAHTGSNVGFYNVAAAARQLLATGAGHTVDDVITALQTLGLLRQS